MTREEAIECLSDYSMLVEDYEVVIPNLNQNALVDFYITVSDPVAILEQFPQLLDSDDIPSLLDYTQRCVINTILARETVTGVEVE